MVQIALTLFPGVSGDECEAFSLILDQLPDVEFVHVGADLGPVPGSGRVQVVDHTFASVPRPDIVLVPGGLGTARTARDDELTGWLHRVEPTCRWVVGSSTGTVLLAAAGLIGDRPVATHWLAGPLLETYGAAPSTDRIVEYGRVITCEGQVTAAEVAVILTARLFGKDTARRVLADLPRRERPAPARPRTRARVRTSERDRPLWTRWFRGRGHGGPGQPANAELEVSEWIDLDPVEMDVIDP